MKCSHLCVAVFQGWRYFCTQLRCSQLLESFMGSILFRPNKPCLLNIHCLMLALFCILQIYLILCKLGLLEFLDPQRFIVLWFSNHLAELNNFITCQDGWAFSHELLPYLLLDPTLDLSTRSCLVTLKPFEARPVMFFP